MSIIDKVKAKVVSLKKVSDGTLAWLEELKKLEDLKVEIVEVRITGSFKNEDMEIHLKYRYNDGGLGYEGLKLIHPLKEYFRGNVEVEPIRFNKPMYETVLRWREMLKSSDSKVFIVSLDRHATLREYLTSLK